MNKKQPGKMFYDEYNKKGNQCPGFLVIIYNPINRGSYFFSVDVAALLIAFVISMLIEAFSIFI